MNDFNNSNQPENPFNVSKRVLIIILTASLVLVFCFGFYLSMVIMQPNPDNNNNNNSNNTTIVNPYADLYEFLDSNYYQDIDVDYMSLMQLVAIVDALNDPYTRLQAVTLTSSDPSQLEPETFEGLGVTASYQNYQIVISAIMDDSPAQKAKLYPGDKIIGLVLNDENYYFKDDELTQDDAMNLIRGKKGNIKSLIIKRLDNQEVIKTIEYDIFSTPTVISQVINENYAYIKLTEFSDYTATNFANHLKELEKTVLKTASGTLILDLRNNPGGNLSTVVNIIRQLLVNDGTVVAGIKSTKSQQISSYKGGLKSAKPYNIKVLVNGNSASASEMLAAALHYSGNYEIYGTPTFGKNVFQQTTDQFVNYGLLLTYTKGYWFYKDEQIIDKEKNPIPVNIVEPKNYLVMSVPTYTKDLSYDLVSQELILVQMFLNVYYDYDLRIDGYFDLETENAIKDYQSDKGLEVTGVYDLAVNHYMYDDYYLGLKNLNIDNQVLALLS